MLPGLEIVNVHSPLTLMKASISSDGFAIGLIVLVMYHPLAPCCLRPLSAFEADSDATECISKMITTFDVVLFLNMARESATLTEVSFIEHEYEKTYA